MKIVQRRKIRRMTWLLAMLVMSCNEATRPIKAETVQTHLGTIRGVQEGGTIAFKGIPFAKPPLDSLRWRAPVDPDPWTGVRETVEFSNACLQLIPNVTKVSKISEDCLYLNIWTPSHRKEGEQFPVMFWIHGGAQVIGSGGAIVSGHHLAEDRRVVIVSTNYRLGIFGWLAHPALTKESGTSGSYGFLDQVAALKWVQKNIVQFGGDPNKVTVFGASAGGINTCAMLVSPLAMGLFHRAIVQSGGCRDRTLEDTEKKYGIPFAKNAGCILGNVASCLRSISAETLLNTKVPPQGEIGMGPVVDGIVLPDASQNVIAAGKHNHVPLIIGANAQDTYTPPGPQIENMDGLKTKIINYLTSFAAGVYIQVRDWDIPAILKLYPLSEFGTLSEILVALRDDVGMHCKNRRIARLVADHQAEPVYWYDFFHTMSGEAAVYRAKHGIEETYIFRTLHIRTPWFFSGIYTPTIEDEKVSDVISQYWSSFANSGNPNGLNTPFWQTFESNEQAAQRIGVPTYSKKLLKVEKCNYWDQHFQVY